MPRQTLACTCVSVLLILLAGVSLAPAQAKVDPANPPKLDIPADDLTGTTVRRYRRDIEEYVKFWAAVMEQTGSEATLIRARKAIVDGYTQYDNVSGLSPQYYGLYADQAAESVGPLLKDKSVAKQINAAIVQLDGATQANAANAEESVSSLPRISMQNAYDTAVAHKNPAVRYLGWRGYNRIRDTVLAQGRRASDRMFKAASTAAAKETAAEMITVLFNAMAIERNMRNAATVSDDLLSAAQTDAFGVIRSVWPKMLAPIVEGDTAMTYAGRRGLGAIRAVWPTISQDKASRSQALQMAVNLTHATARAYLEAGGGDSPVAQANLLLLRDAEKALQRFTGTNQKMIEDAMTDADIQDPVLRAKAVVLASIEWANKLADQGVEKPTNPTAEKDKE